MTPILEALATLKIVIKVHDMVKGDRPVTEKCISSTVGDFSGKRSFHSYGNTGYEIPLRLLGTQTSDS